MYKLFKKEFGVDETISLIQREEIKVETFVLKKIENFLKKKNENKLEQIGFLFLFNPLTNYLYYKISFIFLSKGMSKLSLFYFLFYYSKLS